MHNETKNGSTPDGSQAEPSSFNPTPIGGLMATVTSIRTDCDRVFGTDDCNIDQEFVKAFCLAVNTQLLDLWSRWE